MQIRVAWRERAARWRASFADLGPLRPVFVAVAVLPTLGLWAVLAALPQIGAALAALPWAAVPLLVAAVTGGVLLPPSIAVFAAGYGLGAPAALAAGWLGTALGGLFGQRCVWPLLGAARFAWMRRRPRVVALQWLLATRGAQRGVAALRSSAVFPFAAGNLLLAAARAPAGAVLLGGLVAAAPPSIAAAFAGAALRTWRDGGELRIGELAAIAAGVLGGALAARRGRHAWRAARVAVGGC